MGGADNQTMETPNNLQIIIGLVVALVMVIGVFIVVIRRGLTSKEVEFRILSFLIFRCKD